MSSTSGIKHFCSPSGVRFSSYITIASCILIEISCHYISNIADSFTSILTQMDTIQFLQLFHFFRAFYALATTRILSLSEVEERKGKCREFTCNLKADKISLVYHTNQQKRRKEQNKRKTNEPWKWSKNPWDPSEKVRGTMEVRIYRKGKFWVWSGTEMEWCIVKVVMMMVMMMNRWKKYEMTVWQGLIIDRLAKFFGKFLPETRWGMAERAIVDFHRGITT